MSNVERLDPDVEGYYRDIYVQFVCENHFVTRIARRKFAQFLMVAIDKVPEGKVREAVSGYIYLGFRTVPRWENVYYNVVKEFYHEED